MNDAALWRWIRILAILLAVFYVAVGIIGGIAVDFDAASDRLFWMLFLIVGAAILLLGVAAATRSRWLAVAAMGLGGIIGSVAIFWAVLPPLATLILIILGVLWARRPGAPAAA